MDEFGLVAKEKSGITAISLKLSHRQSQHAMQRARFEVNHESKELGRDLELFSVELMTEDRYRWWSIYFFVIRIHQPDGPFYIERDLLFSFWRALLGRYRFMLIELEMDHSIVSDNVSKFRPRGKALVFHG